MIRIGLNLNEQFINRLVFWHLRYMYNSKYFIHVASSAHHRMAFFLIRWLLFRLMFASGIVKLTSMCPTWWHLTGIVDLPFIWWLKIHIRSRWLKCMFSFTALNYHFESQVSVDIYRASQSLWQFKFSIILLNYET